MKHLLEKLQLQVAVTDATVHRIPPDCSKGNPLAEYTCGNIYPAPTERGVLPYSPAIFLNQSRLISLPPQFLQQNCIRGSKYKSSTTDMYPEPLSVALALACGLLVLAFALRARTWARLRHIPGPPLAGLTEIWLLRATLSGRCNIETLEVCRKYGTCAAASC